MTLLDYLETDEMVSSQIIAQITRFAEYLSALSCELQSINPDMAAARPSPVDAMPLYMALDVALLADADPSSAALLLCGADDGLLGVEDALRGAVLQWLHGQADAIEGTQGNGEYYNANNGSLTPAMQLILRRDFSFIGTVITKPRSLSLVATVCVDRHKKRSGWAAMGEWSECTVVVVSVAVEYDGRPVTRRALQAAMDDGGASSTAGSAALARAKPVCELRDCQSGASFLADLSTVFDFSGDSDNGAPGWHLSQVITPEDFVASIVAPGTILQCLVRWVVGPAGDPTLTSACPSWTRLACDHPTASVYSAVLLPHGLDTATAHQSLRAIHYPSSGGGGAGCGPPLGTPTPGAAITRGHTLSTHDLHQAHVMQRYVQHTMQHPLHGAEGRGGADGARWSPTAEQSAAELQGEFEAVRRTWVRFATGVVMHCPAAEDDGFWEACAAVFEDSGSFPLWLSLLVALASTKCVQTAPIAPDSPSASASGVAASLSVSGGRRSETGVFRGIHEHDASSALASEGLAVSAVPNDFSFRPLTIALTTSDPTTDTFLNDRLEAIFGHVGQRSSGRGAAVLVDAGHALDARLTPLLPSTHHCPNPTTPKRFFVRKAGAPHALPLRDSAPLVDIVRGGVATCGPSVLIFAHTEHCPPTVTTALQQWIATRGAQRPHRHEVPLRIAAAPPSLLSSSSGAAPSKKHAGEGAGEGMLPFIAFPQHQTSAIFRFSFAEPSSSPARHMDMVPPTTLLPLPPNIARAHWDLIQRCDLCIAWGKQRPSPAIHNSHGYDGQAMGRGGESHVYASEACEQTAPAPSLPTWAPLQKFTSELQRALSKDTPIVRDRLRRRPYDGDGADAELLHGDCASAADVDALVEPFAGPKTVAPAAFQLMQQFFLLARRKGLLRADGIATIVRVATAHAMVHRSACTRRPRHEDPFSTDHSHSTATTTPPIDSNQKSDVSILDALVAISLCDLSIGTAQSSNAGEEVSAAAAAGGGAASPMGAGAKFPHRVLPTSLFSECLATDFDIMHWYATVSYFLCREQADL